MEKYFTNRFNAANWFVLKETDWKPSTLRTKQSQNNANLRRYSAKAWKNKTLQKLITIKRCYCITHTNLINVKKGKWNNEMMQQIICITNNSSEVVDWLESKRWCLPKDSESQGAWKEIGMEVLFNPYIYLFNDTEAKAHESLLHFETRESLSYASRILLFVQTLVSRGTDSIDKVFPGHGPHGYACLATE